MTEATACGNSCLFSIEKSGEGPSVCQFGRAANPQRSEEERNAIALVSLFGPNVVHDREVSGSHPLFHNTGQHLNGTESTGTQPDYR